MKEVREKHTNNEEKNKDLEKDLKKETDKSEDLNLKNDPNEKDLEAKTRDLEEKIVRLLAEMENQRRRFEKEKEEAFDFGGFAFAKEALALIDNLDRARISISNNEKFKQNKDLPKFLENLDIIQKDVISIFKKNGIEQIDCLNKKFDPNFHQAMIEIEDVNKEPGLILQEIQKGFKMKDRLLRPSLVGVSKNKSKEEKIENIIKSEKNTQKTEENSENNI